MAVEFFFTVLLFRHHFGGLYESSFDAEARDLVEQIERFEPAGVVFHTHIDRMLLAYVSYHTGDTPMALIRQTEAGQFDCYRVMPHLEERPIGCIRLQDLLARDQIFVHWDAESTINDLQAP